MVFILGTLKSTETLQSVGCFLPLNLISGTVSHPVSNSHRQNLKCNQLDFVLVFIKGNVFDI